MTPSHGFWKPLRFDDDADGHPNVTSPPPSQKKKLKLADSPKPLQDGTAGPSGLESPGAHPAKDSGNETMEDAQDTGETQPTEVAEAKDSWDSFSHPSWVQIYFCWQWIPFSV